MKRILVKIILTLIVVAAGTTIQAQQRLQMKIGYQAAKPLGSFKDVINTTSYRGFNGEITYAVTERLGIGLGVSYNDFYQKFPRQVYPVKDGAVSAVITNSIQTTPILVKANYSLVRDGVIRPYLGLGAGFNLVSYSQYLGEFPDSKTSFKPAFGGDAGVNIPLGITKTAGLNIGANFNYLPFNYNGVKNLHNWGVHAGLYFPIR